MKSNYNLIFATLYFIFFSASCSPTNELSEVRSAKDTMIIAIKQICVNTKYNFTIIPDSVLYDSRCPENTLCLWAGDALVSFKQNSHQTNYNHK